MGMELSDLGQAGGWTSNNEDFMDLSITYIMVDLSDLGGIDHWGFSGYKAKGWHMSN